MSTLIYKCPLCKKLFGEKGFCPCTSGLFPRSLGSKVEFIGYISLTDPDEVPLIDEHLDDYDYEHQQNI